MHQDTELTLRSVSKQDKGDWHPQVVTEDFHCQTKHCGDVANRETQEEDKRLSFLPL
jgi:hypothetical protein